MCMNDYHIYVCKPSAKHFENKIKELKLDEQGVSILMEDTSAKIIIPMKNDWTKIEDILFEWKRNSDIEEVKNAGFWGQHSTCF